MKKKLFIFAAVVVGLAFLLGITWIRWSLKRNLRTEALLAPYRATILVKTNEAIVFRHTMGVGVAQFEKVGHEDSRYKFRALNASSSSVTSGVVDVHHKYLNIGRIGIATSGRDSNYVQAGNVWLLWSYHNPGEAWLTYHSNLTELVVLPDDIFDRIDLHNLRKNMSNHGLESTSAPPAAGTLETHP